MDEFASEILSMIFRRVGRSDLKRLRLVCRVFCSAATQHLFTNVAFGCDSTDPSMAIPGIGEWARHPVSVLAKSVRLQSRIPSRSARPEQNAWGTPGRTAAETLEPLIPQSARLKIQHVEYGPDYLVVASNQPVSPPVAEQFLRLARELGRDLRCLTLCDLQFGALFERGRTFGPFPALEEVRLRNVSAVDSMAIGGFIQTHAATLRVMLYYGCLISTETRRAVLQLTGAVTRVERMCWYADVVTTPSLPSVSSWERILLEVMSGGTVMVPEDLAESGFRQGLEWRRAAVNAPGGG